MAHNRGNSRLDVLDVYNGRVIFISIIFIWLSFFLVFFLLCIQCCKFNIVVGYLFVVDIVTQAFNNTKDFLLFRLLCFFFCLIVLFMISLAALLSILSGAGGCLGSTLSALTRSWTFVCASWYNDPTSASAADATIKFKILAMTMIGLFII